MHTNKHNTIYWYNLKGELSIMNLENKAVIFLDSNGFKHSLNGFSIIKHYLVSAASKELDDNSRTMEIYDYLAGIGKTTAYRVERNIRHSIQQSDSIYRQLHNGEALRKMRDNFRIELDNIGIETANKSVSSQKSESDFHKSRLAFAFIGSKLYSTSNDSRSHSEWLEQDLKVSTGEYEYLIRGYISDNKIYIYTGSKFEPVELSLITLDKLKRLLELANRYNAHDNYMVYNGMKVGYIGEGSKPIMEICTLSNNSFNLNNNVIRS